MDYDTLRSVQLLQPPKFQHLTPDFATECCGLCREAFSFLADEFDVVLCCEACGLATGRAFSVHCPGDPEEEIREAHRIAAENRGQKSYQQMVAQMRKNEAWAQSNPDDYMAHKSAWVETLQQRLWGEAAE